jgi:hypothetical protein
MKMLGRVLSLSWLLLGIGLFIDGVYEVLLWSGDPILEQSSLRWWHSTGIIPGMFAAALGFYLTKPGTLRNYLGYPLAVLFSLYVLYILDITPNGFRLRPMLALQIAVIALSIGTIFFLWKKRTQ